MTPTPAKAFDGNAESGRFGFTIAAHFGSSGPGRWWSVTTVSIPMAAARAMGAALETPLSTVRMRSGRGFIPAMMSTKASVRP